MKRILVSWWDPIGPDIERSCAEKYRYAILRVETITANKGGRQAYYISSIVASTEVKLTDFVVGSDSVQTYAAGLVCASLRISSGMRMTITTRIKMADDVIKRLCSCFQRSRKPPREVQEVENTWPSRCIDHRLPMIEEKEKTRCYQPDLHMT